MHSSTKTIEHIDKSKAYTKLLRDPISLLKSLEKGNILFKLPSMETYRVVSFIDKESMKIKIKSDSSNQVMTLCNENISEFTFFRNIKVILVNYLERVYELNIPFYINQTLEMVKDDFCTTYKCFHESIGIIFKDKRLTNKDLSKVLLYKDFDFDNHYLVFVQAKSENILCKMEADYTTLRINPAQVRKSIIIVENPMAVSSFFISRPNYKNNMLRVNTFEIFEIDENPKKYYKVTKKTKSDTETCENYNFDSLLIQDPAVISNAKLIYSRENLTFDYENEKEDPFYGYMKTSYKQLEVEPELIFLSEKIYFTKINCVSTNNIRGMKYEKGKKSFTDDNGLLEISQFLEKKQRQSLINGIEYRLISTFEMK